MQYFICFLSRIGVFGRVRRYYEDFRCYLRSAFPNFYKLCNYSVYVTKALTKEFSECFVTVVKKLGNLNVTEFLNSYSIKFSLTSTFGFCFNILYTHDPKEMHFTAIVHPWKSDLSPWCHLMILNKLKRQFLL